MRLTKWRSLTTSSNLVTPQIYTALSLYALPDPVGQRVTHDITTPVHVSDFDLKTVRDATHAVSQ